MRLRAAAAATALLLIVACGDSRDADATREASASARAELARRLDEAGLWRGLSAEARDAAVAAVAGGTHPLSTELSEQVEFFADGEKLAEGGVEEFLSELAPALADLGVEYTVRLVSGIDSGTYTVAIDHTVIELYDESAWDTGGPNFPWYASTVRPLAKLNRLLADAGRPERLYTLYTGENDGIVLLIPVSVVDVLVDAGLTDEKEMPLLAS